MRCPQSALRALAAAAIAGAVVPASSLTSISSAMAAIYSPQQALPATTIQQFLANPAAWLAQYPSGGADLIKAVRDLAASDPQTLNALIGLLASANPDQASAIGTGLGQAAEMAINSDPTYAGQIQTAIIGAHSNPALVAFSAIVGGDIKLAASTAGVGAGGAGEAPTGSNTPAGGFSGSALLNFPSSANNTADSFPGSSLTPGTPGQSVSQSAP